MASAKSGVHIMTLNQVDINERLQTGEMFLKWSEQDTTNNACPVVLKVDSNGFFLFWRNRIKKFASWTYLKYVISDLAPTPKFPKIQKFVILCPWETRRRCWRTGR